MPGIQAFPQSSLLYDIISRNSAVDSAPHDCHLKGLSQMTRKSSARSSRRLQGDSLAALILFLSMTLLALAGPGLVPLPGGSLFSLFAPFSPDLAAAQETTRHLEPVRFIPQWQPQAQFAGYYVALEKGFYRQQGLQVEILQGGPDRQPPEMLKTGAADFGTLFLAAGIVRRARGLKLVNLCQVAQHSALMLVARKSAGITLPPDINGKKVGLWGEDFQAQIHAFFRKYHLQVETIPQGTTMNLFLRGGVDVASAMLYNEYHLLLNAGLNPGELSTFLMSDYGFDFPEDGIYCLEKTFRDRPRVCRAFVQASIAGWQYAFAHPEEALDIVMKYVNSAHVPTDRVHQRWMLLHMRTAILANGPEGAIGGLKRGEYYWVAQTLKADGIIQTIPDYAHFYPNGVNRDEKK